MWGAIDDMSDGSPSSIAVAVGGGLATPITGVVDAAALIVLDSAMIVSYPVRAVIQSIGGNNHKVYRAVRMLNKLKNGKTKTVSHKTFTSVSNALAR